LTPIKAQGFGAEIHSRRKASRQEIIAAPTRPVETSERRISVSGDGTDHPSAGCAELVKLMASAKGGKIQQAR
jgi:hypothetical protein